MVKNTKIILGILLIVQLIGLRILSFFPEFVEKYYSLGIFPFISKIFRYLYGWIPFSVGDVLYSGLIILGVRWLFLHIKDITSKPLSFFLHLTAILSISYMAFNIFWGFNYYRVPLHQTLKLDKNYSTQQLTALTHQLTIKANQLHQNLGFKDSIKVALPYSQKEMFEKAALGYDSLSKLYPTFTYHPKSIKTSSWSLGLTYMGYSGYYNPFTAEAQVNDKIIAHRFAVVSCHETAHQLGYAAENEANFLAYLASTHNNDPYFQYAGTIFALKHCLNEIAKRDPELYKQLLTSLHFGIVENYREVRDFWKQYEGPTEFISKVFFDHFLKANNQEKGLKSYSYMVALLVNYHLEKPL